MPRWSHAKKVSFKYGLGDEFIEILKTLISSDSTPPQPVSVKGAMLSPRDLVAAVLPDPASIGPLMKGKTCAGVYVTGTGRDGRPRKVYIYHVADNEWTMKNSELPGRRLQTAINPVIALELIANGTSKGTGVLGPEALDAKPFLTLLGADARRATALPGT